MVTAVQIGVDEFQNVDEVGPIVELGKYADDPDAIEGCRLGIGRHVQNGDAKTAEETSSDARSREPVPEMQIDQRPIRIEFASKSKCFR